MEFLHKAEQNKPTEVYTAESITSPIKEPQNAPVSRLNAETPNKPTLTIYNKVGNKANKDSNHPAKNLARTIWVSFNGFVSNNSNVPDDASSENNLIVKAGTKKRNNHGDNINNPSTLA